MEQYLKNEVESTIEDSLKNGIRELGINLKRDVSDHEYHIMEKYMQGEISYDDIVDYEKVYSIKLMCLWLSNGNLAEYNSTKADLKAIDEAEESKLKDENPLCVSIEVGKQLQDKITGNYAPAHTTHFEKGLGINHGLISRNDAGLVYHLFKKGVLREITIHEVKTMIFNDFGIIISDIEGEKLKVRIDRDRKIKEGQMLQGEIGDSKLVKDAISIITNKGKEKHMTYEQTNILGTNARKMMDALKETGKIAGKAQIQSDKDELERKFAKAISNYAEAGGMDISNIISCVAKNMKFW